MPAAHSPFELGKRALGGYRTDITEDQLRGARTFYRDQNWDWGDRNREQELHDYYRAPYYWG